MSSLDQNIQSAVKQGLLLDESAQNIKGWFEAGFLPQWAVDALDELVQKQAWEELNDRFFKSLAFGTGGMRGRTIGKVSAQAELGNVSDMGTPEHAAVGTNLLNDFNIARATIGLFRYTQSFLKKENRTDAPRLVIAHDMRHFSRHFCELAASAWTRLGGQALIFDGPRSTPQLSFSVRHFKCHAGVVITASHNPAHDNGFKAYFEDGAQVVFPHAEGIIDEVNAVQLRELPEFLQADISKVETIARVDEKPYLDCVISSVIDVKTIAREQPKIVYTPVHGTGQVMAVPALRALGLEPVLVESQLVMDPRFPTVKSPNPENAETFAQAVKIAESAGADVAIATDPDDDRVGIAVRSQDGGMKLLTGNMTGAMLLENRLQLLKEKGIIPRDGGDNVAVIKTFVTTPLQDAIAQAHGVKLINTLTGFKWIGERLQKYEEKLEAALQAQGKTIDYDTTPNAERTRLLLEHSTYFAFGGEESYGYLASDLVRDKDGNSAVCLVAELAARLKKQGMSFEQYLDNLYLKYGYTLEDLLNIYYEGASGAAKIKAILDSYRSNPPVEMAGQKIIKFTDFGRDTITDADGYEIPKENFYFLELANGWKYAVRGSGTEPKIKFYLFARADVAQAQALPALKKEIRAQLDAFKSEIEKDAHARAHV